MKTVRMMLAVAIVVAIAIPAMAQEKKAPKGKWVKLSPLSQVMVRMGKLRTAIKDLDLTAEQEEKLGKVRGDLGPKFGEAFGKLKDIFTEEQRTAAEEAGKKASEAGKEGRALMLAIEASVKPTDEQQEKLAKVAEELRPVQREMFRKVMGILTPEQKEKVKKAMAPQGRKKRE